MPQQLFTLPGWLQLRPWVWLGLSLGGMVWLEAAIATPVPDASLGSQVRLDPATGRTLIEGGTERGSNLFHSFQEFNVNAGQQVYFQEAATGTENIITRVRNASGNPSQIFGTLGVDGDANLFLLDPNGIVFGPDARLDVNGSFVATSASELDFGTNGRFSATADTPPPPTLTINPSAFVFNQANPGAIALPRNPATGTGADLEVPAGESLVLLGGNVQVDGGRLTAPGGRIELGAVSGSGTINLDPVARTPQLSFPTDTPRANIALSGRARLDTSGGGNIVLTGQDISILDSSRICAVSQVSGACGGGDNAPVDAGNIAIDATGTVLLQGLNTRLDVTGTNGGNIGIVGENINILDGSRICAGLGSGVCGVSGGTPGGNSGVAGNILISANNTVRISGPGTRILNRVNQGASGNNQQSILEAVDTFLNTPNATIFDSLFGSIFISANTIEISNLIDAVAVQQNNNPRLQGRISTSTLGNGNAGLIFLNGDSTINIAGTRTLNVDDPTFVIISSGVLDGADGDAGAVFIQAPTISTSDYAGISTSTNSSNRNSAVGPIALLADDPSTPLAFDGTIRLAGSTRLFSNIEEGAVTDRSGFILVRAGTLSVLEGSQLQTLVRGGDNPGRGTAGIIRLDVNRLIVDGFIESTPDGAIEHNEAFLPSSILSELESGATGSAGTVLIDRVSGGDSEVTVSNGGRITVTTFGNGNAGSIRLTANRLVVDRFVPAPDGSIVVRSFIASNVAEGATGDGGLITLTIEGSDEFFDLEVTNSGRISATTFGNGSAGTFVDDSGNSVIGGVLIYVDGNALVGSGGRIFSRAEGAATGNAGNVILLSTGSIGLLDDSFISTSSVISQSPSDEGGNVILGAEGLLVLNGEARVSSVAFSGQGGLILLNSIDEILRNPSVAALTVLGEISTLLNAPLPRDDGNFLVLADGSSISTTSGFDNIRGDGGNIGIGVEVGVWGSPSRGNYITARSFNNGSGGVINFFNPISLFEFVLDNDPQILDAIFNNTNLSILDYNYISVRSSEGDDGLIVLNQVDADPTRGLVQLPGTIVDPADLIAQACPTRGSTAQEQLGSFTIIERGGVPPAPGDLSGSVPVLTDWVVNGGNPPASSQSGATRTATPAIPAAIAPPSPHPLVEANAWGRDANGDIWLVTRGVTMPTAPAAGSCPPVQ